MLNLENNVGDIGTGSFCLTFEGTKRTGSMVPIITGGSMEYKYLENQRILIFRITEEIDEFVGDAPQFDDITMLGFKYLGNK